MLVESPLIASIGLFVIGGLMSSQDARPGPDGRLKTVRLEPALRYIEANIDRRITVAEVARAAGLSPSRLSHLFRDLTGNSVMVYVAKVRTDLARRLLLETEISCSQICFQVGYCNQSYFTRIFKRLVGVTPARFRELNRPR